MPSRQTPPLTAQDRLAMLSVLETQGMGVRDRVAILLSALSAFTRWGARTACADDHRRADLADPHGGGRNSGAEEESLASLAAPRAGHASLSTTDLYLSLDLNRFGGHRDKPVEDMCRSVQWLGDRRQYQPSEVKKAKRQQFSPEYKLEAVRLSSEGTRTGAAVAADLGIPANQLASPARRNWRRCVPW
jgi:hypothetical protein